MDKRTEDRLLEAAFGDLSPEEANELELLMQEDPQVAELFTSYRDLNDGLKGLRDVPEHQLSTERLRHAILEQGLKPKRAGWRLGWLWAPSAAAAAVVLGYLAMDFRNSRVNEPELFAGSQDPRIEEPFVLSESNPNAFSFEPSDEAVSFNPDAFSAPKPVTTDAPERTRRHSPLPNRRKSAPSARVAAVVDHGLRVSDEPYGPPAPDEFFPAENLEVRAPRADRTEIIVIDSEKDQITGANRATEVDSAKNVVIGG